MNINYIDSYLKYDNYYNLLSGSVSEKTGLTNEVKEIKSWKLVKKIFSDESPVISIKGDSDSFRKSVIDIIKQITMVKPGRRLFKQLLTKKISFFIEQGLDNRYKPDSNSIHLNLNENSYYYTINEIGELVLTKRDPDVTVFHETTHVDHVDTRDERKKIVDGILENMDNLEEQITVSGISSTDTPPDPISENGYLLAKGLPLRISHRGISIPCNETISKVDKMLLTAIVMPEKVNEFMSSYLEINSEKALCHVSYEDKTTAKGKKIFPFSAACYFGNENLVNYLIEMNSDPSKVDDLGGPLQACFYGDEFDLAKTLIQKMKISTDQVTKNLNEWGNSENLKSKKPKVLKDLIASLSDKDKCFLFKSMITNEKNFPLLSIILATFNGKEKDVDGNTILNLLIKFFIASSNKPLNYGYFLLWEDLRKIPNLNEIISCENTNKESPLVLAQQLNDAWILKEIDNIQNNTEVEECFGNMIRPFSQKEFMNYYI